MSMMIVNTKMSAFLLIAALTAACETTAPEPCTMTVQLDDAPITLAINDSTRVIAHVSATALCQAFSRRVEWSVTVPRVELTAVNDTTIQVTGLSAGTTMLRARAFARLSAQDSVQITVP
jgi:hypothetical protein